MVQMRTLGEQALMPAAGGNGGPSLCERMAELLAGDAHHQGSAWTQLARLHGWPAGRFIGIHRHRVSMSVLLKIAAFVNRFCGHNQGMTDPSPTLQFDLDANAIRLLHRSLSFYLEKWPGGPDPREQEDLQKLRTLFYAALLECSFHEDGQR